MTESKITQEQYYEARIWQAVAGMCNAPLGDQLAAIKGQLELLKEQLNAKGLGFRVIVQVQKVERQILQDDDSENTDQDIDEDQGFSRPPLDSNQTELNRRQKENCYN